MKRNELAEIKGLDIRGLFAKQKSLKEEIAGLVMDKNMKKLKDTRVISKKKKDLAQILTVMRQKQLLEQLEAPVKEAEVKKGGKQSLPSKNSKEGEDRAVVSK